MRNLFALLLRMLASIAAALGLAAVARKYSEPPPGQPEDRRRTADDGRSTAPLPPSASRLPPAGGTQPEHGAALKPGWSRPKPEKIPPPTYWPAVFGFGLTFIMWGIISNIYLLCFGLIVAIIGLVYWVLDLRHEYSE
jgi:hypothetical protein